MISMRSVRRLIAVVLVLTLAAAVAGTASAKRPPTPSERAAIRSAMLAFIRMEGSPVAQDARVTRIRISTVNARYATAETFAASAGYGVAVLRHRGGTWRVRQFGSDIGCGAAPKKVLQDLLGGCVPI
jgi:hypothetical protein